MPAGFSHAGSRKGKNDDRHLWPYVRNAIHALRPRYAILRERVMDTSLWDLQTVLADNYRNRVQCGMGNLPSVPILEPHTVENEFSSLPTPHDRG